VCFLTTTSIREEGKSERRDPEERGRRGTKEGGGGREVGKNSGLKGREG
jgi:hypothetical protein